MTKEEFENRTGLFPSARSYAVIERFYYDFAGEKDSFCDAYRQNRDNLAYRIQTEIDAEEHRLASQNHREMQSKDDMIERLKLQITDLKKALDKELEWKVYEDPHNVSQEEYAKLRDCFITKEWKQEDILEYLKNVYGFRKDRIHVLEKVPILKINRHNQLRVVGDYKRTPLYASSDWNYVRFDCGCMQYELCNDELRFFVS